MKFLSLLFLIVLVSCKTTTYYISRHAEKNSIATMTYPPLTATGQAHAFALRDYLKGKNIAAVYSTNYVRTKATAQPTAELYNLPVTIYNPSASAALVDSLKNVNTRTILIVGHS